MTTKRFLIPVLALAAFGLPASADAVMYCNSGCGANTMAAFNTATSGLGAATQDEFTAGNITIDGGSGLTQYLDPTTGLLFFDDNFNTLSIVGTTLEVGSTSDSGLITVPTGVTAFVVGLSAGGSSQTYTINGTSVFLLAPAQFGFIDAGGNIGNILISRGSGGPLIFDNFDVSGGASQSETPEVGTLLLIGFGLIAMRWMKRVPRRRFFFRTLRTA
jgi:hypothetical protein